MIIQVFLHISRLFADHHLVVALHHHPVIFRHVDGLWKQDVRAGRVGNEELTSAVMRKRAKQ